MDDIEATGRYILDFDQGKVQDETYFTPDYCLIHLDQFIAPAGYAWVFPKGKSRVNIGLGVSKSGLARRNKKFKTQRQPRRRLIDKYVKDNPAITNGGCRLAPITDGNSKGELAGPRPEAQRLHGRQRVRPGRRRGLAARGRSTQVG